MQDHREVERLFAELRDPAKRAGLVPVLTTLLTAHSRAEESQVYPAASAEAGIADKVEHSQEEHLLADQLLADLAATDPDGAEFEQVLDKLVEAITHHVEEEESDVLPGLRAGLDEDRLRELGEAFLASRQEHLGEQPTDITKSDLEQQAANVGLTGASAMSKDELQETLAELAEE